MKVTYQPGDFFSSSPIQPPNLFGLRHDVERERLVEYLREVADKIEGGELLTFEIREGCEIVGFEVL